MYVTDAQVEPVYRFIWTYVTEREELPTARQVAVALDMPQEDVHRCIWHLRAQKRLSETTLKPTGYEAWWRENVRAGQRWNMPELPTAFFRSRKVT